MILTETVVEEGGTLTTAGALVDMMREYSPMTRYLSDLMTPGRYIFQSKGVLEMYMIVIKVSGLVDI